MKTGRVPVVAALLALLTMLTFVRLLDAGFQSVIDDNVYVLGNSHVLEGFTGASVRWAFTNTDVAFWHPVTWLSHMADVEFYGLDPRGHHLSSVLLHAAASAALFAALAAMTGALWRSTLVAALFAVHPLHVESVAWVAERKDVLCALFWFLGTGAYVRYVRRRTVARYLALVAAFAAALMSKTMAVTFPFTLLLLDIWPLGRLRFGAGAAAKGLPASPSRASVLAEKIPLLLAVPIAVFVSHRAQVEYGAIDPWLEYPFWARACNALISYSTYLVKTAVPTGLVLYYPHPAQSVSIPSSVASGTVLLFLTALAVRLFRSRPYGAVGWLWYLGTLVPVIGLVQAGQFARADRYTYVPLVGIFVVAVWAAADLCTRLKVRPAFRGAAAAVVVLSCATATWVQTGYWRDEVALWTRTARLTRDNVHALIGLGLAWQNRGELERAAEQFREAIRINDNLSPAMFMLADVLDQMGRPEEAAIQRGRAQRLEEAVRSGREVPLAGTDARGGSRFGPRDYNNAGVGLVVNGKFAAAEAQFRKALELAPDYAGAHYNLANVLRDLGRHDEALAEYRRTLLLAPDMAAAHLNVGIILRLRGDLQEARAAFRKALEIDPALDAARAGLKALDAVPQ